MRERATLAEQSIRQASSGAQTARGPCTKLPNALPVIDESRKIVGVVREKDVFQESPA